MSLYSELKRRNVFRVAAAYVVVGWLILQLAEIVLGFIGAPDWVGKAIIALLVLGFVPALAVAWIFEVTDDGIVRDDGNGNGHADGNGHRARRLDIVTLVAVVIVAIMVFWQHLQPASESPERSAVVDDRGQEPAPADGPVPAAVEILPNSIAVLPFANRSAEDDTQFFVDGVHDDLLTQLARFSDLKVISRTSVMEYRDTTKNMRQIGQELGVATLLEGAVQRAGMRVRITAQLIDAETDEHLWADSFDRELTPENIFDIQSDIARAIAGSLVSTLSPEEIDEAVNDGAPTSNPDALDAYLQARARAELFDTGNTNARIDLYRRAVELDPDFASAWGELGYEVTNLYWFTTKNPVHREEARGYIDRALRMDPDDPRLHWIMADHLYHGELDYAGALRALETAERGMPGAAEIHALRGWILRRSGDLRGAIASLERAGQLNPRDFLVVGDLLFSYGVLGDLESVDRWSQRLALIPNVPPRYRHFPPATYLAVAADLEPMRAYLAEFSDEETFGRLTERYTLPLMERDWDTAAAAIADFDDDPVIVQWRVWPKSFMRARLAWLRGERETASRHAEQALVDIASFLEAQPDDARAIMTRAQTHAILGEEAAARADAARARALYPPEVDAFSASVFLFGELLTLAVFADAEEVAAAADAYLSAYGALHSYQGLMLHPELNAYADHPAFLALAAHYPHYGDDG
jgi:TolB-like protein